MSDDQSRTDRVSIQQLSAFYAVGWTAAVLLLLWAMLRVSDGQISNFAVSIQKRGWMWQIIGGGILGFGYAYLTSSLLFRKLKNTRAHSLRADILMYLLIWIQVIGLWVIRDQLQQHGLLAVRSSFLLICYIVMAYVGYSTWFEYRRR